MPTRRPEDGSAAVITGSWDSTLGAASAHLASQGYIVWDGALPHDCPELAAVREVLTPLVAAIKAGWDTDADALKVTGADRLVTGGD